MRKLKIYFDTSIISHLDQQDAPDKTIETHKLIEKVKANEYDVVISTVTERELEDCPEPKRSILLGYLKQIPHTVIPLNEEMLTIADKIIELGILKQKSLDDCQHIAAAIISGCDVIVSWNFKHIVNHKTMQGVKAVTAIIGYPEMLIYTPTILIEGDDYNGS
jgi:predicted nucleic acid-binding protein